MLNGLCVLVREREREWGLENEMERNGTEWVRCRLSNMWLKGETVGRERLIKDSEYSTRRLLDTTFFFLNNNNNNNNNFALLCFALLCCVVFVFCDVVPPTHSLLL